MYPSNKQKRVSDAVRSAVESLEPRKLLAADLVISEFLASNNAGLADQYGVRQDWIEIHNRGDASAPLNDYSLTDDPGHNTLWRFPVQSLAPGGYLVVFASDRNELVVGQPLHTNFKLSAGGEYLALLSADGLTAYTEFAPFPVQTTDVSYGYATEDSPTSPLIYFPAPTPGVANAATTPAPVLSAGKAFNGTYIVTMADTMPTAQIRYTTNGAIPTSTSTLYTGPVSISANKLLRARAFSSTTAASAVVSGVYSALDSTVSGFNSNLPIVILDTYGVGIGAENLTAATAQFIDTSATTGRALAVDAPNFSGRIGLRRRGQSSEDFPQKAYAIETWDEANDDKKVSLLGMPTESDWILYAPYSEKSLMQNALAMGWSNEMGHYASRTRYVELFFNTNNDAQVNYSSDYAGVYILMEKIKISDDRVNIAKLSPADNSGTAVTGGYIWKKDKFDAGEIGFATNGGQNLLNVEPEYGTITTAQQSYLTGYINEFYNTLYNDALFKDPVNGYAKYIDVNSWIDSWLLVEFTKNVDGLHFSTYYSKDRNGKIKMEPIWDYNLSMGNADYGGSNAVAGWHGTGVSDVDIPYFRRLFLDPDFNQKVIDRWEQLRQTTFSNASITTDIAGLSNLLSDNTGNFPVGQFPTQVSNNALVRNFKRWNTLGVYVWPNGFYDSQGRYTQDVQLMQNFLLARAAWIDSQWTAMPTITPPGGQQSGSSVQVTLSGPAGATLYYTLDDSDPRAPTGAIGSAAIQYTGPFNIGSSTRVRARARVSATNWGGVNEKFFNFGSDSIRVTELMFNPTITQDNEYIELTNVGASTISLNGYHLTSGVTFTMPRTASLAPGQVGLLVKNLAAFQARYGTTLNVIGTYTGSLDNGGETLAFANGLESTIQSFAYANSWYSSTAGGGFSLEAIDPTGAVANWALQSGWRASFAALGSPGVSAKWVSAAAADRYYLRKAANGNLEVVLNDSDPGAAATYTLLPSAARTLVFDLGAGDDLVSIGSDAQAAFGSVQVIGGADRDTLHVSGATPITASTTSILMAGVSINFATVETLSFGSDATIPSDLSGLAVNVVAGQTTFSTTQNLSGLSIEDGAAAMVPQESNALLRVGTLTIGASGALDLNDNDLVATSATKSAIESYIASAYNFGDWTGAGGIFSTTAKNNPNVNTMLGAMNGSEYFANANTTVFDGLPVLSGDVLVKYTYFGDVDFNGQVDTTDYNLIDFGFLTGASGWANGDVDYNSQIDTTDYNLIDFAFLTQDGIRL